MPHAHHECSKIFSGVKKRRSECVTPEKSFLAHSPERTKPHPTCQRTHAPRRGCAWGRGVWTLAEASVDCRVMSVATAAGAEASEAE